MAQDSFGVLDDTNMSNYRSMSFFEDGFENVLDSGFENHYGMHFEGPDAGTGGFGACSVLEQGTPDLPELESYFINNREQSASTSSQGGSYTGTNPVSSLIMLQGPVQLIIPARGQPELVRDIPTDVPGLSSNTPSLSEISGDAPTPPASPSALCPTPSTQHDERASAVQRKRQECHCRAPLCKNQKFTRQEGLDRHNGSKHGLNKERFVCQYCTKTRTCFPRLDKARSHWENIHKNQGPFLPGKEKNELYPAALKMYESALYST